MKSKILLMLAISVCSTTLHAQSGNVGIGTTTPHANALLELNSNSKGLLAPRLTTAQRDAITATPEGLVIYNLDIHCLEYWNGTQWISDCTAAPPPGPDLTATCTGAYIPYTANNGSTNITVNGTPVTASFSNYTNIQAATAATDCGVSNSATPFRLGAGFPSTIPSSMQMNFNRYVSNLKVYIAGSHNGEVMTFTLKNGGVTVSPTYTVSTAGTCNTDFTINAGANTITCNGPANVSRGIIVNLGGVWFDEITIAHNGVQNGSTLDFCVGAAGSPIPPSVATLNCAGASIAPNTVTSGSAYTGTLTVPYTGGNGSSYSAGSPIASTGVTGLTATLQAGTLANGAGNLTYAVSGTPGSAGTASFPISFNGATSCSASVTVNAPPPPTPDLTATCTGAYLPSTVVDGGNTTVTVNSVPVTASFSNYSFIQNNNSGVFQCGILVDTYYGFGTVNNVAASMKINFSTEVTNLKLYLGYVNGGESITFTLKNNGAVVSPTYTLSPAGTCNGNFTINAASNTISANGAPVSGVSYNAILNIGGVWFDEITVSSGNPFGGVGVRYCVGNAQ